MGFETHDAVLHWLHMWWQGWVCMQETSFIGKRLYSFTWFFFSHQFMTISFYIVLVLHPLPGLPGNPRPHASTSWVSQHVAHHTSP